MPIIMHIDMDSFYASVEMKKNPSLKNKPLVIGADPKAGHGRGVVMTSNYPARKFGIKSGMSISRAYKLCPDAVFLLPNMELYIETSNRIMKILRRFADKFEQVSVDEAFLDVSRKVGNFKDAEKIALEIKSFVSEKENLTCSIGIGENKLIAKISSDFKKPDGLTIVLREDSKKFLEPLPADKIPGIGPKSKKILEEFGIKTIGDLQKAPLVELIKLFGNNYADWIYSRANGIDNSPVEENYEVKSINRNITFDEDTEDLKLMYETIEEMARDVHNSLSANNLKYKTITLRVRYDNFDTFTRAKSLADYSNDFATIVKICNELLEEFLDKRKIRQLGVRVSNFENEDIKTEHKNNSKQKSILDF